MAPMEKKCSGMTSSPSSRPKTSVKARRTPRLAATPPWKETGLMNFFPLAILLFRFRATAKHNPAMMS